MLRSKLFVLASLLFVATGCIKPQRTADGTNGPQSSDDVSAGATFYVAGGGKGEEGHISKVIQNAKWQIPMVADFFPKVCLKDRAAASQARGQKFEIEIPNTSRRILPLGPSDGQGCITWPESLPFPYFAKRSAPILLTRYIVGTGVLTGKAVVKFYVDPWAVGNSPRDSNSSLVFWKESTPPPNLLLDEAKVTRALDINGNDEEGADLWVSELDVQTIDRKDFDGGSAMEYQIKMNPMVEWIDSEDMIQFKKLNTGYFEVLADLVATDAGPKQDQKVILTEDHISSFAAVRNGELFSTLKTVLKRDVPLGNVSLVIKLIPRGIEGSRPLKEYEAVYELGDITSKPSKGRLIDACVNNDHVNCNMKNFLKGANNFDALKAINYARDASRLSFGGLKLRFVTVAVTPPETATQRTVSYSASTCITDRRTGDRIKNMPFHVEYVDLDDDGNEIPTKDTDPYQRQDLVTDDEGCLRWLAHVWHQYYMPEHYFVKHVKITMGETKAGGTLHFILNPWDDKFTFGFDQREVSKDFVSETVRRIKSRFFTAGYGYHTLRFMYDFDKYMNLEVKKTILLEIDPRVLRYSGIVNARRTTEKLRDGIYLLKVAIEKNYFDPVTPGLKITPDPDEPTRSLQDPPDSDPKAKEIPKWGYVDTATLLVRVVDGRLIKPVELSMRDLRLMRMRSNLLFELQTVDEQKLAADSVLQEKHKEELRKTREYRDQFKQGIYPEDLTPDQFDQKMVQRATETQAKLKRAWDGISTMLEDQKKIQPQNTNLNSYQLPEDLLKPLADALNTNDFTLTNLPSCEDTDCERFVEDNSGLESRTFVGPVTYLSNGYSDAVRPTDNLDEACNRPDNPFLTQAQQAEAMSQGHKDNEEAYRFGEGGEDDWFGRREGDEGKSRRNRFYTYNRYYGSLSHLCNISVDKLIEQQRKQTSIFRKDMDKIATLENFVGVSNADFLKLSADNAEEYKSNDNVADPDKIVEELNQSYRSRALSARTWIKEDLAPLFYGAGKIELNEHDFTLNPDQIDGFCNLFANRAAEAVSIFKPQTYGHWYSQAFESLEGSNAAVERPNTFAGLVYRRCVARATDPVNPSLRVDERLRVFDTGVNYKFNGGLQVNLNVGESISVGSSGSYSKSLELSDLVTSVTGLGGIALGWMYGGGPIGGGLAAAFFIHLIRPLSGKGSASIDESEGTTVSDSTYLVAQIAKFDVELKSYERCLIYRLDPSVLESSYYVDLGALDPESKEDPKSDSGPTLRQVVTRGIMVCDGKKTERSRLVPEDYFWFTQHFTEGDMLDQADLLNHPWLMGLRGDRDFGLFLNKIKAHEAVTPGNLGWGLSREPKLQEIDWPLEQLARTYKGMPPTFPGFYTVLRASETVTKAPLNERIIPIDKDINGEVCNDNGCANRFREPYDLRSSSSNNNN